jgi:hypothetical protein
MEERIETAVLEWAKRVPIHHIPDVLVFLSTRLLAEGGRNREDNGPSASDTEKLLTAGELAGRLNLPESWVRTEERAGRIPGIRAGRYVRFKVSNVEPALAEGQYENA